MIMGGGNFCIRAERMGAYVHKDQFGMVLLKVVLSEL